MEGFDQHLETKYDFKIAFFAMKFFVILFMFFSLIVLSIITVSLLHLFTSIATWLILMAVSVGSVGEYYSSPNPLEHLPLPSPLALPLFCPEVLSDQMKSLLSKIKFLFLRICIFMS